MRTLPIRFTALAVVALMAISAAHVAQAALIVYDAFGSTSGTNLGSTTPTTPNPNTSGTNQKWYAQASVPDNSIAAPGLSFPSLYHNAPPTSGNAVALSGTVSNVDRIVINSSGSSFSTTQPTAGDLTTAYYSLLLQVPSNLTGLESHANQGQSNVNGGPNGYNQALVASFTDGNGTTGGLGTQITGVYLSAGSAPNTVDIGIGGNRNGVVWSSDVPAGSTYFLAASMAEAPASTYTNSLWINPALGLSSAPATSLTTVSGQSGGNNDNAIVGFDVTSNPGLPNSGVFVDEVRIGTTWADVTPAGLSVPEPSSLVLAGLGAVGLIWSICRRRKA